MKLFWVALDVGLIGLPVWTGYSEMDPQRLSQANPQP
jgi:hypothetical protein